MMNKLRLLTIIITSPFWLLMGGIILGVCIPLLIVSFIIALCEYGFNGEWDWII